MDLKMNRPKIEITSIELDTFLGGSNPIAIYISQLNNYIDQLEKALDKACVELAHTYPCGINSYGTNCHPDSWKEWCMKNETDSSKIK